MSHEYKSLRNKHQGVFGTSYVPIFNGNSKEFLRERQELMVASESCPTCIGASDSGNTVVVGYSDDSLVLHDVRSNYQERMQLEIGGHTNTVKSVAFS